MNFRHLLPLLIVSLSLNGLGHAAPASPTPIFNGRDLTGWKVPEPNPFWTVVSGVLVGENNEQRKGSMLWTEKSYGNFILDLEVRWNGEIDSGVMLRKPELQLQFGVSRSLKRDMTGSFYTGGKDAYPEAGRANQAASLLKAGEWNRFRLEARGTTFTVFINGQPASTYTDAKYAEPGPIGLQIHGGLAMKVEFRQLLLTELP